MRTKTVDANKFFVFETDGEVVAVPYHNMAKVSVNDMRVQVQCMDGSLYSVMGIAPVMAVRKYFEID